MNLSKKIYSPALLPFCKEIFLSNCPKYFAEFEFSEFLNWLKMPEREPYYVYFIGEKAVACAGIYARHEDKEAGMAWGMVLNEKHQQGIGSQITQIRIREIKNKYPDYTIRLKTTQHTAPFYEKMGFKTVKIDPNGFTEGMDCFWMEYT